MKEGETREELLAKVKNIHDYADVLRSYMGTSYINEWSSYMGGPNYPKPIVGYNTSINRDTIKHLVDALGDENPLYRDPKYAAKTKYGTLIAPPSWPFSIVYGHYPEFAMWEYVSLYCGDTFEWYKPVADGDKIDWKTTFPTDVVEKETKTGGTTVFCHGTHEFKRHQGGMPLLKQTWTQCYIEMVGSNYNTAQSGAKVPEYTEEYIEKIHAAWDEENKNLWGGKIHYFEDVTVGETLPPVVRGPFTVMESAAWIKAASQYYFCSDRLHKYIHEASGWGYYDKDLKVWLNFHENEYDCYGAMAQRTGSYVPGGFGSQRCAWATTLLSNFASDEGFVWKMDVRHVRKGGYFNTFWTRGTVTDKHCENGRCWVDIDIEMKDQNDVTILKGTGQVILPSREHGMIVYPEPETPFTSFHA